MVIRDVVFHFACLNAERLHIGKLYGACLALWGCGHTCSTHVRNGNLPVYIHWDYHSSPNRLISSLEKAGFGEADAGSNL